MPRRIVLRQANVEFDGNGWELLWLHLKRTETVESACRWFITTVRHYGNPTITGARNRLGIDVVSQYYQQKALQSIHHWRVDEKTWLRYPGVLEEILIIKNVRRIKKAEDAALVKALVYQVNKIKRGHPKKF